MKLWKKLACLVVACLMLFTTVSALAEWDGTITIVQSSDVIGFDPTASTDTNNKNVLKNMVSRLYETDDYFNVVPVLATSYTQVDNYTWEFKIAQNVKFLRITTSTVYGSMLTALSNSACTILSKVWIDKAEAGECPWEDVVRYGATGRYILGERNIGNSCTLIKNENYFDPNDAALNKKLIFRIIPEATTRTIMVQTGEADVNVNFDTAAMDDCLKDPNVEVLQQESSTIYYIALNCEKGPFTNKALRQAVAWAIERADCLEVGYNGYGKVWSNVWAPTVFGAKEDPYTYDPEKAAALVAESGYAGQERYRGHRDPFVHDRNAVFALYRLSCLYEILRSVIYLVLLLH